MTKARTYPDQLPDAVVWIDEDRALVAKTWPDGGIATVEIWRDAEPEIQFLARVVHSLGEREHVVIIGPADIRLALEREYVAISHSPDRLMAAPEGARQAGAEIVGLLQRLAA